MLKQVQHKNSCHHNVVYREDDLTSNTISTYVKKFYFSTIFYIMVKQTLTIHSNKKLRKSKTVNSYTLEQGIS